MLSLASRLSRTTPWISISSLRCLNDSTPVGGKTPKKPRRKPRQSTAKQKTVVSASSQPSSNELLKDFLSPPVRESATAHRMVSKTIHRKELDDNKQDVISSSDLLKDFLNETGELKQRISHARVQAERRPARVRYLEPLPHPEKLNLFDKSIMTKIETHKSSGYDNQVFEEILSLEASTYRAKSTLNKFDELIKWTLDGKLWRYPIDNEQDWSEEAGTGFHEHVFLDRFVATKSSKSDPAPLKAFMKLVCAGLGQNPYITVDQKKQHLLWFESYFADKAKQIQEAVDEEKRLAEIEAKARRGPQTNC